MDCPFPTTIITLHGAGFHLNYTQNVIVFERVSDHPGGEDGAFTPTCVPVASPLNGEGTLLCQLETSGTYGSFRVRDIVHDELGGPVAQVSISAVHLLLRPTPTAIDGCDQTNVALTATYNCRAGNVLTITGRHFSPRPFKNNISFTHATSLAAGNFTCAIIEPVSNTLLFCTLHITKVSAGPYVVRVSSDRLRTLPTNPIFMDPNPAPAYIRHLVGCNATLAGTAGISLYGCRNNSVVRLLGEGFSKEVPRNVVLLTPKPGDGGEGLVSCRPTVFVSFVELHCRVVIAAPANAPVGGFIVQARVIPRAVFETSNGTLHFSPELRAVDGCGQYYFESLRHMQHCRNGDRVTVYGFGFSSISNFPLLRHEAHGATGAANGGSQGFQCISEGVNPTRTEFYCRIGLFDPANASALPSARGWWRLAVRGFKNSSVLESFSTPANVLLSPHTVEEPLVHTVHGCTAGASHREVIHCHGDNVSTLTLLGFNFFRQFFDNGVGFEGTSAAHGHPPACTPLGTWGRGMGLACGLRSSTTFGTFRLNVRHHTLPPAALFARGDIDVPHGNITIRTAPVIASIHGCTQSNGTHAAGCFAGHTITVTGTNFGAAPLVLLNGTASPATAVTILSQAPDSRTMVVSVPAAAPHSVWLELTVVDRNAIATVDPLWFRPTRAILADYLGPSIVAVDGCNRTTSCTSTHNITLTFTGLALPNPAFATQVARVEFTAADATTTGLPHCAVTAPLAPSSHFRSLRCSLVTRDASGTFNVSIVLLHPNLTVVARTPPTAAALVTFAPLVVALSICSHRPGPTLVLPAARINSTRLPLVTLHGLAFPTADPFAAVRFRLPSGDISADVACLPTGWSAYHTLLCYLRREAPFASTATILHPTLNRTGTVESPGTFRVRLDASPAPPQVGRLATAVWFEPSSGGQQTSPQSFSVATDAVMTWDIHLHGALGAAAAGDDRNCFRFDRVHVATIVDGAVVENLLHGPGLSTAYLHGGALQLRGLSWLPSSYTRVTVNITVIGDPLIAASSLEFFIVHKRSLSVALQTTVFEARAYLVGTVTLLDGFHVDTTTHKRPLVVTQGGPNCPIGFRSHNVTFFRGVATLARQVYVLPRKLPSAACSGGRSSTVTCNDTRFGETFDARGTRLHNLGGWRGLRLTAATAFLPFSASDAATYQQPNLLAAPNATVGALLNGLDEAISPHLPPAVSTDTTVALAMVIPQATASTTEHFAAGNTHPLVRIGGLAVSVVSAGATPRYGAHPSDVHYDPLGFTVVVTVAGCGTSSTSPAATAIMPGPVAHHVAVAVLTNGSVFTSVNGTRHASLACAPAALATAMASPVGDTLRLGGVATVPVFMIIDHIRLLQRGDIDSQRLAAEYFGDPALTVDVGCETGLSAAAQCACEGLPGVAMDASMPAGNFSARWACPATNHTDRCAHVCGEACGLRFGTPLPDVANVSVAVRVRNVTVVAFALDASLNASRAAAVTFSGTGLGAGDAVILLPYRAPGGPACPQRLPLQAVSGSLDLAAPATFTAMTTDPFILGANTRLAFALVPFTSGDHAVCYYAPGLLPFLVGTAFVTATVNQSHFTPRATIADVNTAIAVHGYGLSPPDVALRLVLVEDFDSTAQPRAALAAAVLCGGNTTFYDVTATVADPLAFVRYRTQAAFAGFPRRGGCYGLCVWPHGNRTAPVVARDPLCVRTNASDYRLPRPPVAGVVWADFVGAGFSVLRRDDIVAVPVNTSCEAYGAYLSANGTEMPDTFRMAPDPTRPSNTTLLPTAGLITRADTYQWCFRSWVVGVAASGATTRLPFVPVGRPFVVVPSVRIEHIVLPPTVFADDVFAVRVNGTGLHPTYDGMILIEAPDCSIINAAGVRHAPYPPHALNAVTAMPPYAVYLIMNASVVDATQPRFTAVAMTGATRVAATYSVCYKPLMGARWIHVRGRLATHNASVTVLGQAYRGFTRTSGVSAPNTNVFAMEPFTLRVAGRGLDHNRDQLYLVRLRPHNVHASLRSIAGDDPQRLCANLTAHGRLPTSDYFLAVARPTVLTSVPRRGLYTTVWNTSLAAQGTYALCYANYQYPFQPTALLLRINVTARPTTVRAPMESIAMPHRVVGTPFNITVRGAGLDASGRDMVLLVKVGTTDAANAARSEVPRPTDCVVTDLLIASLVTGAIEIYNPSAQVVPLHPYSLRFRRPVGPMGDLIDAASFAPESALRPQYLLPLHALSVQTHLPAFGRLVLCDPHLCASLPPSAAAVSLSAASRTSLLSSGTMVTLAKHAHPIDGLQVPLASGSVRDNDVCSGAVLRGDADEFYETLAAATLGLSPPPSTPPIYAPDNRQARRFRTLPSSAVAGAMGTSTGGFMGVGQCAPLITINAALFHVVRTVPAEGLTQLTALGTVTEGGLYRVCYNAWHLSGRRYVAVDLARAVAVPYLSLTAAASTPILAHAGDVFTLRVGALANAAVERARPNTALALWTDRGPPLQVGHQVFRRAPFGLAVSDARATCVLRTGAAECRDLWFPLGYYGNVTVRVSLATATMMHDSRYWAAVSVRQLATLARVRSEPEAHQITSREALVTSLSFEDALGFPVGRFDRHRYRVTFSLQAAEADVPQSLLDAVLGSRNCSLSTRPLLAGQITTPCRTAGGAFSVVPADFPSGAVLTVLANATSVAAPVDPLILVLTFVSERNHSLTVRGTVEVHIVPGPAVGFVVRLPVEGPNGYVIYGAEAPATQVVDLVDADGNTVWDTEMVSRQALMTLVAANGTLLSLSSLPSLQRMAPDPEFAASKWANVNTDTMSDAELSEYADFVLAGGVVPVVGAYAFDDGWIASDEWYDTEAAPQAADVATAPPRTVTVRTAMGLDGGRTAEVSHTTTAYHCAPMGDPLYQWTGTAYHARRTTVTIPVVGNAFAAGLNDFVCELVLNATHTLQNTSTRHPSRPCVYTCTFSTPGIASSNATLVYRLPNDIRVEDERPLYITGRATHVILSPTGFVVAPFERGSATLSAATLTAVDDAYVPVGERDAARRVVSLVSRGAPTNTSIIPIVNVSVILRNGTGLFTGNFTFEFPYTVNVTSTPLESHALTIQTPRDTANTYTLPVVVLACPVPPVVTAVRGCRNTLQPLDIPNCHPLTATITVTGKFFGAFGAVLLVAGVACNTTVHDTVNPTTQIVAHCPGSGLRRPLTLQTTTHHLSLQHTVSYNNYPVVTSITGCSVSVYPHAFDCDLLGRETLTITGHYFGPHGARVRFVQPTARRLTHPNVQCHSVRHYPNDREGMLNCTGFGGFGENLTVTVTNIYNMTSLATTLGAPTMSFLPTKEALCPKDASGIRCSTHGRCDLSYGVCLCDVFWAGDACDRCITSRFGSACTSVCPGGLTVPCSGPSRGTCFDGQYGNGTCLCVTGYTGTACDLICPGGVTNPCNGHGTCAPVQCSCFATTARGYWGGTDCSTCAVGYGGAQCTDVCPFGNNSLLCSGHGTCGTGGCQCQRDYCSADCGLYGLVCNECPNFYGPGCDQPCPVGPNAKICSSNGACSSGRFGTGECLCYPGYTSTLCQDACPGGVNNPCNGHGTCVSKTVCSCNVGYGGTACSVACPGGTSNICSLNGRCLADGTCECFVGYRKNDCSALCPGGVNDICGGHGICDDTGVCQCSANLIQGFWSGTVCGSCAANWFGVTCSQQCPFALGSMCGGHGVCKNPNVVCECDSNDLAGFWQGLACSECQPGYYGSACRGICPGGACVPCFNNGVCDMGREGSGSCTCNDNDVDGHWVLPSCATCITGYWGGKCTNKCKYHAGQICAGHGTCNGGTRGDGNCTCFATAQSGYWADEVCTVCRSGYFGPQCDRRCPGSLSDSVVCTGHGQCSDGLFGTGACFCQADYQGEGCALPCPKNASGVLCSLRGSCVVGSALTAKCDCIGNYSGASCHECKYNHFGALCAPCPCAVTGICSAGIRGNGSCTCLPGYVGSFCEIECAGGASSPCNGHGVCDVSTGTCTCDASTHYIGSDCNTCEPAFESRACDVLCPVNSVTGDICSLAGTCFEGVCFCQTGHCGQACEISGAVCTADYVCPAGRFGSVCNSTCPGYPNATCSLHGLCDDGKRGIGVCLCARGYTGTACERGCPGLERPCHFNGLCDDLLSTCACFPGYAGYDCHVKCPSVDGVLCGGHGTCDDGASGTGRCVCSTGWSSATCTEHCPGGLTTPCSFHGVCESNVTCTCSGNYGGTICDRCAQGWRGLTCDLPCAHGETIGIECVCYPYWSGPSCNIPCPGLVYDSCNDFDCINRGNSNCEGRCAWDELTQACYGVTSCVRDLCGGRGVCTWGANASGTCRCKTDYYGSDCTVPCTKSNCLKIHGVANAECAADGSCGCQDNDEGHFDNLAAGCVDCKANWYGPSCAFRCPCNEHGGCNQVTGDCQCSRDFVVGFWDGDFCQSCYSGYIGEQCTQLNVQLTRLNTTTISTQTTTPDYRVGFLYLDAISGIAYIGSSPFFCRHLSTGESSNHGDLGQGQEVAANATHVNLYFSVTDPLFISLVAYSVAKNDTACTSLTLEHTIRITRTSSRRFATQAITDASDTLNRVFMGPSGVGPVMLLSTGSLHSATFDAILPSGLFSEAIDSAYFPLLGSYVLGGAINGTWKLYALAADLVSVTDLSAILPGTIPFCPCSTVLKVYVYEEFCFVTLQHAGGIGVIRFSLLNPTLTPPTAAPLIIATQIHTIRVTDMILDPLEGLAFLSVHINDEPTQISKFYYKSSATVSYVPTIRGYAQLDTQGFEAEVLSAMYPNLLRRTLWGLVTTKVGIRLAELSLYAVASVYPPVADTLGGTAITVSGEGFAADGLPICRFGDVSVAAVFVSSRTLLCEAPPGGDDVCEGYSLEVGLWSRFTLNVVRLRRSSTPIVASALNEHGDPHGHHSGGTIITVSGYGFVTSPALSCRIVDDDGLDLRFDAVFETTSAIACTQPALGRPTKGSSTLLVSIDGHVWSESVPFTIVGAAFAIKAVFPPTNTIYKSSDVVELLTTRVDVVDAEGHSLLYFDTPQQRSVVFSMPSYVASRTQQSIDPTTTLLILTGDNTTDRGTTFFRGAALRRPIVGTATIKLAYAAWVTTVQLLVDEGEPYQLQLFRASSRTIDNRNPKLEVQPVVEVVDVAGNSLRSLSTKTLQVSVVTATYFVGQRFQNSSVVASPTGFFEFTDISMRGFHGSVYRIAFSAEGVLPVSSQELSVGLCADNEYGVAGTVNCVACPSMAVCNGSHTFALNDGYWRAGLLSYDIYSCGRPFGEPAACSAGVCVEGYTGPRCTQCTDGFGKAGTTCSKCLSVAGNVIVLILIIIAVTLAIAFLINTSLRATKRNPLPVLLKILLNHLQIGSQLGGLIGDLPDLLLSSLGWQKSASSPDPSGLGAVSCLFDPNFYQIFLVVVALPWLIMFIAIVVLRLLTKRALVKEIVDRANFERDKYLAGPFNKLSDLEERKREIGLTATADTGAFARLFHDTQIGKKCSYDAEKRRKELNALQGQLDKLLRAARAIFVLPASSRRTRALEYLKVEIERQLNRIAAVEDTFSAAATAPIAAIEKKAKRRRRNRHTSFADESMRDAPAVQITVNDADPALEASRDGFGRKKRGSRKRDSERPSVAFLDAPAFSDEAHREMQVGVLKPRTLEGSFSFEGEPVSLAQQLEDHMIDQFIANQNDTDDAYGLMRPPEVKLSMGVASSSTPEMRPNESTISGALKTVSHSSFESETTTDSGDEFDPRRAGLDDTRGLSTAQVTNAALIAAGFMSSSSDATAELQTTQTKPFDNPIDDDAFFDFEAEDRKLVEELKERTRVLQTTVDTWVEFDKDSSANTASGNPAAPGGGTFKDMYKGASPFSDAAHLKMLEQRQAIGRALAQPDEADVSMTGAPDLTRITAIQFTEDQFTSHKAKQRHAMEKRKRKLLKKKKKAADATQDVKAIERQQREAVDLILFGEHGDEDVDGDSSSTSDEDAPAFDPFSPSGDPEFDARLNKATTVADVLKQLPEMDVPEVAPLDGGVDNPDFGERIHADFSLLKSRRRKRGAAANKGSDEGLSGDAAAKGPASPAARRVRKAVRIVYSGKGTLADDSELLADEGYESEHDDAFIDDLLSGKGLIVAGVPAQEEEAVLDKGDGTVEYRGYTFMAKQVTSHELLEQFDANLSTTFARKALLAAVVVFLLLYPTLIEKCLLMVKCEDISFGPVATQYGDPGTRNLLYSDRSIDCSTAVHARYSLAALVAGLAYGIGIPLSITSFIIHLRRTRGEEDAMSMFAFYTAGYAPRWWFWEGVILFRKFVLVCISVFVANEQLRLYTSMWFLASALIFHTQAHPFTNSMVHNVETLSLATIVVTLNLAMLFEYTVTRPSLHSALALVLLFLNMGAIAVIIFFMTREVKSTIRNFIQTHGASIKRIAHALWTSLPGVSQYYVRQAEAKERADNVAEHEKMQKALAAVGADVEGGQPSITEFPSTNKNSDSAAADATPETTAAAVTQDQAVPARVRRKKWKHMTRWERLKRAAHELWHYDMLEQERQEEAKAKRDEIVRKRMADPNYEANLLVRGRRIEDDRKDMGFTSLPFPHTPLLASDAAQVRIGEMPLDAPKTLWQRFRRWADSMETRPRRRRFSEDVFMLPNGEVRDVWRPPTDPDDQWADVADDDIRLLQLCEDDVRVLHAANLADIAILERVLRDRKRDLSNLATGIVERNARRNVMKRRSQVLGGGDVDEVLYIHRRVAGDGVESTAPDAEKHALPLNEDFVPFAAPPALDSASDRGAASARVDSDGGNPFDAPSGRRSVVSAMGSVPSGPRSILRPQSRSQFSDAQTSRPPSAVTHSRPQSAFVRGRPPSAFVQSRPPSALRPIPSSGPPEGSPMPSHRGSIAEAIQSHSDPMFLTSVTSTLSTHARNPFLPPSSASPPPMSPEVPAPSPDGADKNAPSKRRIGFTRKAPRSTDNTTGKKNPLQPPSLWIHESDDDKQ